MINVRFQRASPTDHVVLTGQAWNDIVSAIERMDRLVVSPPMYLSDNATGKTISITLPVQPILWATLKTAWTPGDLRVTMTPCESSTDDTDTGDPDVLVFLQQPFDEKPTYCGAEVDEIYGYFQVDTDDTDGSPVYMIWPVNPLPRPTDQYQIGLQNMSSDPTKPNYVADWLRAGP